MTCPDCRVDYPSWMLPNWMLGPICAPCALDRTNEIHGANLECFVGEEAESLRQSALAYREKTRQQPARSPALTVEMMEKARDEEVSRMRKKGTL